MNVQELLEAKVMPDWVRQEEQDFRTLVKRYGFTVRKRPTVYKNRWTFGGQIVDVDKKDISLPLEKRVAGLQLAVAQHLFNAKEEGREVVIYAPERYRHVASRGHVHWQIVDFTPKHVYPGDSLPQVEGLVKDRLFLNYRSGDKEQHITFQYGMSDPSEQKVPGPAPKTIRVVKGAK